MNFFIAILLFIALQANAQERVPEVRMSLGEARQIWLVPTLAFHRSTLDFENMRTPGDDTTNGAELGLHVISSSNRARTFFAGLDLRQTLSTHQTYATRLGIRMEWRPLWAGSIGVSGGWYFGDTVVAKERDLQFNGNSFALAVSHQLGRTRLFVEGNFGTYKEGPGFIYISRRSGPETLKTLSLAVGVEIPFDAAYLNRLQSSPEDARVRPNLSPRPYSEPL